MITKERNIIKWVLIACLFGLLLGLFLRDVADQLETEPSPVSQTDTQAPDPSLIPQTDAQAPKPSLVSQVNTQATGESSWPMAGANPQRTSWSPETLPGNIRTVWVKPIVPYISQHVQVVGAAGKVYVSTAEGLYAFEADTGAVAWVYPTELPLGHSPTYDLGYLYVGGMDRKLHKVSASDG